MTVVSCDFQLFVDNLVIFDDINLGFNSSNMSCSRLPKFCMVLSAFWLFTSSPDTKKAVDFWADMFAWIALKVKVAEDEELFCCSEKTEEIYALVSRNQFKLCTVYHTKLSHNKYISGF